MKELIATLEKFQDLSINIKSWCAQNQIKQPNIMSYTLKRIQKLHDNYLEKYCSKKNFPIENEKSSQPVWQQNQLILFQWTVIAFSLCSQIYVKEFTCTQIQILSTIYRNKQIYVLQYEIRCMLVKGKQIRNAWKIEQEKLFSKIIRQIPEKNKWNQIARQLYKASEGHYFRQGKHCRERWYSYVKNGKSIKDESVESNIKLLQQFSDAQNKQFSVSNNFEPSQSRQFLKKRSDVFFPSAKSKFQHQIQNKEVIALLRQQNYKKVSKEKNILPLRKQRTQILDNQYLSLIPQIDEKIVKEETDRKRVDNQSQCENNKLSMKVDQEINAEFEGPESNRFSQENDQQNFILFTYPTQIVDSSYSVQYMPVQFYSQTPQMILTNLGKSLNWFNFFNPHQLGEFYYFS